MATDVNDVYKRIKLHSEEIITQYINDTVGSSGIPSAEPFKDMFQRCRNSVMPLCLYETNTDSRFSFLPTSHKETIADLCQLEALRILADLQKSSG